MLIANSRCWASFQQLRLSSFQWWWSQTLCNSAWQKNERQWAWTELQEILFKQKLFLQWEGRNMGKDCPEKLWSLHHWRLNDHKGLLQPNWSMILWLPAGSEIWDLLRLSKFVVAYNGWAISTWLMQFLDPSYSAQKLMQSKDWKNISSLYDNSQVNQADLCLTFFILSEILITISCEN